MIVTRETSRQTVVTFKTRKGAENRVQRDAEWFANAAEPGTVGEVQVTERWDADQARTLFDVDYVVSEVLEQPPVGATVLVSGPYSGRAAYGYTGTVEGPDRWGHLHVTNGRTGRWILQPGDRVQVLALPEPDEHPDTDDAAPALLPTDHPDYDEAAQQEAEAGPVCAWFARCDRTTTQGLPHPVLGLTPCCERCARRVGEAERLVALPS